MAQIANKDLRTYVYGLLDGNVLDDASAVVPVTNFAYAGIAYPHITVQNFAFAEDGTKDRHGGDYGIVIEVSTRFEINFGGQDQVDEIASNIIALLPVRKSPTTTLGTGLQFASFSHRSTNDFDEEDEQYRYVYKRMIFEAYILDE